METKQNQYLQNLLSWIKQWVLPFLAIYLLAILFRIPNLLSRNLWFDGDEGIVGIMARDWANGVAFPTYFYGQNYGFSLFEVLSVAFWIKILGSTVMALRLGGLMVFAAAGTFFWKAFERKGVARSWRVVLLLLYLTFPSWMMWGSMVRGGYVGALFCVAVLTYLFTSIKVHWSWAVAASFFFAAGFENHVFLLVPFLPFLLKLWLEEKHSWKYLTICLAGAGVWVVLIKLSNFYDNGWQAPPVYMDFAHVPQKFGWIFTNAPEIFGDFFFYELVLNPPTWWYIFLVLALLLLLVFTVLSFVKKASWEKVLWLLGMLSLLLVTTLFSKFSPRYLISFFTGFLVLVFFQFLLKSEMKGRIILLFLLVIQLIGIGVGSKIERDWYDFSGNQIEEFEHLYQEVKSNGKKAVFMTDNLGQWQWNYLYGEEIPCSIFRRDERVSRFSEKVYHYYDKDETQVAIIGLWGIFWEMDFVPGFNDYRYQVGEKYFYMDHELSKYIPRGEQTMQE